MSDRAKKRRVATRDGGWTCNYCTKPLDPAVGKGEPHAKVTSTTPTLDHVVPRSKGGTNTLSNLVLACPDCNGRKGDRAKERFVPPARRRTATPLGSYQHGTVFDLWVEMYGEKRADRIARAYPAAAAAPQ